MTLLSSHFSGVHLHCSGQRQQGAGGDKQGMAEAHTSTEGENGPLETQAPPRVNSKERLAMPLPEPSPKMLPSSRPGQDQVGCPDPGTRSIDQQWSELYQQTPTLLFEEQNSPQCQKQSRLASRPTTEVATSSLEQVILSEVVQNDHTLHSFVALVAARLLTGCNAPCDHSREVWLTEQTMGGLADLVDSFCPPMKSAGTVCQAVRKDLQRIFWSKRQLDTLVLMEHPAVDGVIVQCLQAHIRSMSAAELAKEAEDARRPPCFWRCVPSTLVFGAVVGILWLLVIFFPS